jgi:uncharacterized short protein YbdD (DUF466 family)
VTGLRVAVGRIGWYVREVMGEGDYDRYLAHHRRDHPDRLPMNRREFERCRMDERDRNPRMRCC